MMFLFRVGLTVFWAWCFFKAGSAAENAGNDFETLFYLASCVVVALLVGVVWAPVLAEMVSGPLTGVITEGADVRGGDQFLGRIRRAEGRKNRRLILLYCIIEGTLHPRRPYPFLVGLSHARKGSWLERGFAREVYRFNNLQNCELAAAVLRRHGIKPPPHHLPEVNLAMSAAEQRPRPEPGRLHLPEKGVPPGMKRNPNIRLFSWAGSMGRNFSPTSSAPAGNTGREPSNPT